MRQKLQDIGDIRLSELRFHSALIHEKTGSPDWRGWNGLLAGPASALTLIKLQILAFGKPLQQREFPEP